MPGDREPILDGLRGVAVLGILLINVQLMRGPEIWGSLLAMPGLAVEATEVAASTADQVVAALLGLLASGKFIASFAMLFGVGAAIIAGRAVARGHQPRRLLARRYLWLLPFGFVHMLLLFPGDILFLYGLSGLVLLAFVDVQPRTAWWWGVGLLGGTAAFTAGSALLGAVFQAPADLTDDPIMTAVADFAARRSDQALAAFTDGSYLDVVVANAWQALALQGTQVFLLPYIVGMFLIGFAVGKAGWVTDLAGRRAQLRRIAVVGLAVGLPLNVGLALIGPLGIDGIVSAEAALSPLVTTLAAVSQTLGAPVLAAGYLATLALWWLRRGQPPTALASLGRVALSAYLLQSLLALVVFAGFSLYGQLGTASSLLVVLGIWAVLLTVAPLWVSRIGQGPAERLWRRLTYGAPAAADRPEPTPVG